MKAMKRLQVRKHATTLKEVLRLLALERQALSEEAETEQVSLMTFHAAKAPGGRWSFSSDAKKDFFPTKELSMRVRHG